jgi:uncharacterized membrane protein YkvA (DUF1232 family)
VSSLEWSLVAVGATLLVYLAFIASLLMAGRRAEAQALARFIPDCLVLLHRLLRDERVPRRRKIVLLMLLAYLAIPIDLVPDFIPVVGQLDDVLVAAVAIRYALHSGGPELLRRHWPGPEHSLQVVMRLAYSRS